MTPMIELVNHPEPDVRQAIAGPLRRLNDEPSGQSHEFSAVAIILMAPGFYHKLGYRVFGELPDYPRGPCSFF